MSDEARRQRLLTARVLGAMGSILELLEGGVGGDGVGHVLCPLWHESVGLEAACEGRGKTSAAIDSMGEGMEQRTRAT